MPSFEAPCLELGSAPRTPTIAASPSPSEVSSASSPEPPNVRVTPMFRALAMRPPDPEQPPGQDDLERRLPGYRRIVIPRELTLIELLKQSSGVTTDEEVLRIREAKLRVVAERVGLRRLHILAPRLRKLTLDSSAITSLRDLGIGLVHLKILSINKCNLTSLDGVWGLGALRELYAYSNRIHDLQPLAALQKLHTLDLSENPISESTRLWTLGVCGALRRLTLKRTPVSNTMNYRTSIASVLPMLVYLDDAPLHTDIDYDSDGLFGAVSSSDSDVEQETDLMPESLNETIVEIEPVPSTSAQSDIPCVLEAEGEGEIVQATVKPIRRRYIRRPATTENAGVRPTRPNVPARPKTATERPVIDEPTRLQILNTLLDDEWLGSGSRLTSMGAVCGNLARALRTSSRPRPSKADIIKESVDETIEDVTRVVAAEIPRAPRLEDWIKFKEETGIDIEIDLNNRPASPDPSKILDRLEQIEKETQQRFKEEYLHGQSSFKEGNIAQLPNSASSSSQGNGSGVWTQTDLNRIHSLNKNSEISAFFDEVSELHAVNRERFRFPSNSDSHVE